MLTIRKESNTTNTKERGAEKRKEEERGASAFRSLSHSYGYILPTWWVDYSTNQPHCTQSN